MHLGITFGFSESNISPQKLSQQELLKIININNDTLSEMNSAILSGITEMKMCDNAMNSTRSLNSDEPKIVEDYIMQWADKNPKKAYCLVGCLSLGTVFLLVLFVKYPSLIPKYIYR